MIRHSTTQEGTGSASMRKVYGLRHYRAGYSCTAFWPCLQVSPPEERPVHGRIDGDCAAVGEGVDHHRGHGEAEAND